LKATHLLPEVDKRSVSVNSVAVSE
jgi:hypothetical protein